MDNKSEKGYKVLNSDMRAYGGFKYELGKWHCQAGPLVLGKNGLHFCRRLSDCVCQGELGNGSRVFEVEAIGTAFGELGQKVARLLKLSRELTAEEAVGTAIAEGDRCTIRTLIRKGLVERSRLLSILRVSGQRPEWAAQGSVLAEDLQMVAADSPGLTADDIMAALEVDLPRTVKTCLIANPNAPDELFTLDNARRYGLGCRRFIVGSGRIDTIDAIVDEYCGDRAKGYAGRSNLAALVCEMAAHREDIARWRDKLFRVPDKDVDLALARREDSPHDMLDKLARSCIYDVTEAVADNPSSSEDTLAWLYRENSDDCALLASIVCNPKAPGSVLEEMARSGIEPLAELAASALDARKQDMQRLPVV